MMKSRIASFLVLFFTSMVCAPSVHAEVDSKNDKAVSDLHKGDKAPFDGTLLSLRLAAEIKENCKPDTIEQRCQARIKESVALCQNECTKNTEVLKVQVSACQKKYDDVVIAKDKEIDFLHKKIDELTPAWYESPKLWFGVGLVVGIGGTAYLVKSLSN
jgi:hypothetical protein